MTTRLLVGVDAGNCNFDIAVARPSHLKEIEYATILAVMVATDRRFVHHKYPFVQINDGQKFLTGQHAVETGGMFIDDHQKEFWWDGQTVHPLWLHLLFRGVINTLPALNVLSRDIELVLNVAIPFDEYILDERGVFAKGVSFFDTISKAPYKIVTEQGTFVIRIAPFGKFLPQPEFCIYSSMHRVDDSNTLETDESWLFHKNGTPKFIRVYDGGGGTVGCMTYSISELSGLFLATEVAVAKQRVGFWESVIPAFREALIERYGREIETLTQWQIEKSFTSRQYNGHDVKSLRDGIVKQYAGIYTALWRENIRNLPLISLAPFYGRQLMVLQPYFEASLHALAEENDITLIFPKPEEHGKHAAKGALYGAANDNLRNER